jgi:hypothetical protein
MANGMDDIAEEYAMDYSGPAIFHKNPPRTEIYENLKEIIAVKGPGHRCDTACKRARHTYRHIFKTSPKILGNSDGSLTIRGEK